MKSRTDITRSEKSAKNLLYGVISQFVSVAFTFIVRIVLVRQIGILSVSLNGLFTEVIAILSLAEMGVGSAIVYSLYKPLAERDEKKIVKLMNMYKTATINAALSAILFAFLKLRSPRDLERSAFMPTPVPVATAIRSV